MPHLWRQGRCFTTWILPLRTLHIAQNAITLSVPNLNFRPKSVWSWPCSLGTRTKSCWHILMSREQWHESRENVCVLFQGKHQEKNGTWGVFIKLLTCLMRSFLSRDGSLGPTSKRHPFPILRVPLCLMAWWIKRCVWSCKGDRECSPGMYAKDKWVSNCDPTGEGQVLGRGKGPNNLSDILVQWHKVKSHRNAPEKENSQPGRTKMVPCRCPVMGRWWKAKVWSGHLTWKEL